MALTSEKWRDNRQANDSKRALRGRQPTGICPKMMRKMKKIEPCMSRSLARPVPVMARPCL
ncbi:hypothetical protein MTR_6g463570 [Medicago truncatula]|uniref:Uncharacterized protein n=1 Tax=Medicago truncatula TaxID=3880 RepID=A0A072UAS5_MEDTR|nr:hypothetical protein MTR_6g463570 [Medicago truncatula]